MVQVNNEEEWFVYLSRFKIKAKTLTKGFLFKDYN